MLHHLCAAQLPVSGKSTEGVQPCRGMTPKCGQSAFLHLSQNREGASLSIRRITRISPEEYCVTEFKISCKFLFHYFFSVFRFQKLPPLCRAALCVLHHLFPASSPTQLSPGLWMRSTRGARASSAREGSTHTEQLPSPGEPLQGSSFPVGRQGTASWIFKVVIQTTLALWPLACPKPA